MPNHLHTRNSDHSDANQSTESRQVRANSNRRALATFLAVPLWRLSAAGVLLGALALWLA
jgi:hypothetical protein